MSPGRRRGVYDPWVKVVDCDILDRTNGQGASQERPKRELEGLHWRGWNLVWKVVEKQNWIGLVGADSERFQQLSLTLCSEKRRTRDLSTTDRKESKRAVRC